MAPDGGGELPEDTPNTLEQITSYNNYYEFSTDKEDVARLSKGFKTEPWSVAVGGLVAKPRSFTVPELVGMFPPEERVYRLRCVEGWSMVIPWLGFPLKKLLEAVEPTAQAQYVRFETVKRPEEMPGQRMPFYPWPYVEGLRLDEAQNDLALLVTGLYGKPLPNQNGAPLRLAVPWKYGFKSVKSIAKIELVERQPTSLWMSAAPDEYGFFANVNPDVPHPRWSQATERRIGEVRRRRTLPFNGYAAAGERPLPGDGPAPELLMAAPAVAAGAGGLDRYNRHDPFGSTRLPASPGGATRSGWGGARGGARAARRATTAGRTALAAPAHPRPLRRPVPAPAVGRLAGRADG